MKVYINPEIKIVYLVQNHNLMTGSDLTKGQEFDRNNDVVLSRDGGSFWGDEDDYDE